MYLWINQFTTLIDSAAAAVKSLQSCPTLCDPIDSTPPGSAIPGILQARTMEWVAISFSRRSSQLRDWTQVSRIVGRCFTIWATREVIKCVILWLTEPFKAQETPQYISHKSIHAIMHYQNASVTNCKSKGIGSGCEWHLKAWHWWSKYAQTFLWSFSREVVSG